MKIISTLEAIEVYGRYNPDSIDDLLHGGVFYGLDLFYTFHREVNKKGWRRQDHVAEATDRQLSRWARELFLCYFEEIYLIC